MNPVAIAFWIVCAGIGYLIGGPTGAVAGLVAGAGVSLVATMVS